mgnify:CR=1 FL=1
MLGVIFTSLIACSVQYVAADHTHDDNGKLICDADNKQFNPLVRNDGTGGAFIVWGDQRSGGSYGIYLQRLTNSEINLAENGKESFFGISTDAANEPYHHGAIYLENDEAFIYWQDNRWGAPKIYGTKVSSSFSLYFFSRGHSYRAPCVSMYAAAPRALRGA